MSIIKLAAEYGAEKTKDSVINEYENVGYRPGRGALIGAGIGAAIGAGLGHTIHIPSMRWVRKAGNQSLMSKIRKQVRRNDMLQLSGLGAFAGATSGALIVHNRTHKKATLKAIENDPNIVNSMKTHGGSIENYITGKAWG